MKKLIPILILITSLFAQQTRVNELKAEKIISNRVNTPLIYMGDLKAFYKDADTVKTASNFNFEGEITYSGNMNVDGYLTSKKARVFAYLSENDTTNIVTADSLHRLEGIFINSPIYGFKIANGRLVYTGTETFDFDIEIVGNVSSNTATTLIHMAIMNDDSTYYPQKMGQLAKYANEPIVIPLDLTLELSQYDSITIMIEADKTCEIDTRHATARIRRSD